MTSDLVARYRVDLANSDPVVRAVAKRQLARLEHAARTAPTTSSTDPESGPAEPSRWQHVPLAELFEQAGNRLYRQRNGTIKTGHELAHGSKTGQCVVIWLGTGRWWCSSCRQGGDAATYVMALRGWTYHRAAEWLTATYGPPTGGHSPKSRACGQRTPRRSERPAWRWRTV